MCKTYGVQHKIKSVNPWPQPTSNKPHQVRISHLRLGYSNLTHKYLITRTELPICETCQTSVSVKHILTECKQYEAIRKKYNISTNTAETLGENMNVESTIGYLKNTGLYTLL